MAVQDIISYIKVNEKAYSLETLISQLRKSGYPEEEIKMALQVMRDSASDKPAVFKSPVGTAKKILYWIGGFFVGSIALGILGGIISSFVYTFFHLDGAGSYFGWTLPVLIGLFISIAAAFFVFLHIRRRNPHLASGFLVALIIYAFFRVFLLFGLYYIF